MLVNQLGQKCERLFDDMDRPLHLVSIRCVVHPLTSLLLIMSLPCRVLANSGPINLTEVLSFDSPRGSIASLSSLNNWKSPRSSTPINKSPSGSPMGSPGCKVKVPDDHKNEPNTRSKSPKRASSNHLLQRSISSESKHSTDTKIRTSNRRLMSDTADEKTGTHEKDRPKTTAGRDRKSFVQDHDTSRPGTSGHNRR